MPCRAGCTRALGQRLAGATTVGLGSGPGGRAHAIEGIVARPAGGAPGPLLELLPRLAVTLPALAGLGILIPRLQVLTACPGVLLAVCHTRPFGLSLAHPVACFAVAGGRPFDAGPVHRGTGAVARIVVGRARTLDAGAVHRGAGAVARFVVGGGRTLDTGPVHRGAGTVARLGPLGIVAAEGCTLAGAVELATILLAAAAVAIRHAIAVNGVVLPLA